MKITRSHLAKIIKEEYDAAVSEGFGTELDDASTQARSDLAKRQGRGVGDLIKAANNIRNHIEWVQRTGAALEFPKSRESPEGEPPVLQSILHQRYEEVPTRAKEYVDAVRAQDMNSLGVEGDTLQDVETALKEIELNAGSLADEDM